ncbi:MAG TPA: hypothetical protein VFQ51_06370, partial [Vicinamibacteria bacterium]|nr:hypothetical protein [Vicinamibacteria bacterium]
MTRAFAPCLVLAVLVPAAAHAQTRPLQTEEATTASAGRVVLELGQDFIQHEPNFLTGQPRDRWDGPALRLVYSPADPVEVDLEWVTRVSTPADPVFGHVSDFGDVTLRTKLRFVDGGERRPT